MLHTQKTYWNVSVAWSKQSKKAPNTPPGRGPKSQHHHHRKLTPSERSSNAIKNVKSKSVVRGPSLKSRSPRNKQTYILESSWRSNPMQTSRPGSKKL